MGFSLVILGNNLNTNKVKTGSDTRMEYQKNGMI